MDLCMNGRTHARSYRDFIVALREVGMPSLTHAQASAVAEEGGYLAIRHDVDHRLDRALEMARIEHEEGIRSTYFLLPPGDYGSASNYYGRIIDGQIYASEELAEGALELRALGHEVGLHNDFVQLSTLLHRPVAALIREEIAYFASIGIEVVGSASHGSAFARKRGFTNYEIFAEAKERRPARAIDLGAQGSFELFSIPMAETGLRYEAYWVPRQVYISDTGSSLSCGRHRTQEASLSWIRDSIGSARRIVALIHADWWEKVPPRRDPRALPMQPLASSQAPAVTPTAEPIAAAADAPPAQPALLPEAPLAVEPAAESAAQPAAQVAESRADAEAPAAVPAVPQPPPQDPGRATLGDYGGFLTMLHARGDVRFMTYDDLLWEDDTDHVNSFPEEWDRWRKRVRTDAEMQSQVHVLIQHDTDSGPAETLAMAGLEAAFGVRSSIMTFARRPLRVGEAEIEDYRIEWDGLHSLVRQGFVVGYHCNALHLTCFDEERAAQAFADDLDALAHRGFKIDYFTVHGGPSSPSGMGNSAIDYPALTGSPVRWVNTRYSPRFDGYFSDGGKGPDPSGAERLSELRDFVANMRPGRRYRILLHAQYFEPIDLKSAMCLLPPWPARPIASRAQADVAASASAADRKDLRSPGSLYDVARERARRLFGQTRAWRLLSRIVNAPRRLRKLEASVAARRKEIERLKIQIEDLRDKNQTLYRRTVEYAGRIQRLNVAAAKKASTGEGSGKTRP